MTTDQYERATNIYQTISSIQWRMKRLEEMDSVTILFPEGRFCGEETITEISEIIDLYKERIRSNIKDILKDKLDALEKELNAI